MKANRESREQFVGPPFVPNSDPKHTRPIDRVERKLLADGMAEQMLSEVQHQLQLLKQEKEELQEQLQKNSPTHPIALPQTCTHAKTKVYLKILEHTEPLKSVIQYYLAYGLVNLLTSGIPLLRRGITLNHTQFKELWSQANSHARDTMAFMWALGDLKLSLGVMEIVTSSPPFFIRRFILRSLAFPAQYKATRIANCHIHHKLPTLGPYTHGQKVEIARLQHNHKVVFKEAVDSLRGETTSICFEAVRRHQWLPEHFQNQSTQVTLRDLRDYVTDTLEEQ